MAQPPQITALELIGQAVNVDQIAQAHPMVLGRMGAGMLKGMESAERSHRLTMEIELLAALPSQRKVGQWTTHIRKCPVEVDPLGGTCSFSHH